MKRADIVECDTREIVGNFEAGLANDLKHETPARCAIRFNVAVRLGTGNRNAPVNRFTTCGRLCSPVKPLTPSRAISGDRTTS
jgi:hypothetical protein